MSPLDAPPRGDAPPARTTLKQIFGAVFVIGVVLLLTQSALLPMLLSVSDDPNDFVDVSTCV